MTLHTSTPGRAGPEAGRAGHQRHPRPGHGRAARQANSGPLGHGDGAGPAGPRAVDPRSCATTPRDPEWPDRDRFVLSNGHACILQYSMLHLTGYDLSLEDLRQFRQWGSRTPGPPRGPPHGRHRGHDRARSARASPTPSAWPSPSAGCGPRFGREVCDHRTFVIAGDGCFEEGISHEAASLAGHLGLGPAARRLRRQPHHDRRADRAGLRRRRRRALRGLRLAGAQPRRDGQRRRRPRGGHPRGARPALRRPRRQAHAARPAQPHRLALAPPHRHRQGPRRPPSARRRSASPRRSWACRPTRRSGCPTRSATSTRSEIARGRARHGPSGTGRFDAWDGDRAGWDAAQAGHGLPGLGRRSCPRFEAGTTLATRHAINQCIDATVGEHPGPGGRLAPT